MTRTSNKLRCVLGQQRSVQDCYLIDNREVWCHTLQIVITNRTLSLICISFKF